MANAACVFCKIARGEIPARIVFEDSVIMAFDDIKPQAPVHVVIIPKTHIEKVASPADNDGAIVGRMIKAARDAANAKGVGESGYRIVINCGKDAGQEVPHLHAHLLGGRVLAWPPG
jgi:histidine triad (HIT) family protein